MLNVINSVIKWLKSKKKIKPIYNTNTQESFIQQDVSDQSIKHTKNILKLSKIKSIKNAKTRFNY